MTCKDCLYHECCHSEIAYGMGSDDLTGKYLTDIETRCKSFKNKHDVVEVVRCKECKFYQRCESSLLGEVYVCTNQGDMRVQKEPADFCSWGKKKEGAEE